MEFDQLKRREFITLLGGAIWPLAARAQQGRLPRIGALVLTSTDAQALGNELREGLRELGYVEGQNFAFELRSADGSADRLPKLAAELVHLPVDVIVAAYTSKAGGWRCACGSSYSPRPPVFRRRIWPSTAKCWGEHEARHPKRR